MKIANDKETSRCKKEQLVNDKTFDTSSESVVKTMLSFYENANNISTKFNPTQNRLNHAFLKFLMGSYFYGKNR
jgi:hypothetical protein